MSVIDFARQELKRVDFGEDDSRVMLEILEKFFSQWDSGGAVWVAAGVLRRLIAVLPLSPLTGEKDEWVEVGLQHGSKLYQNRRCPSVFLEEGAKAYDIEVQGRPAITFPYVPATRGPVAPEMTWEPEEEPEKEPGKGKPEEGDG